MTRPLAATLLALARAGSRRRLPAILALAFATTSVGLLAAPPATFAWSANEFNASSESSLIAMQNQARASAGLKSLKLDTDLRVVARWRAKDMVDRDYFSHTIKGTDHNVFWYMQNKYGYCFKVAGENIGTVTWAGASEADATAWVFNAFMNSQGHRDNILGKAWDVVAVGAYKGPGDVFMWAVLFADSCSSSPAPTPKPTPKPTPRPTPRPTPKPTPRPTAKPDKPGPTPQPKPVPTPKPAPRVQSTPKPQPTRSPKPTPAPTPTQSAAPVLLGPPSLFAPTPSPSPTPTLTPVAVNNPPPAPVVRQGNLRIVDQPQAGFVDSILGAITAQFFGG
jgi:uncharacterized protein YkwD